MKLDELEKEIRWVRNNLKKRRYDPFQPNDYNRGFLDGVYEATKELDEIIEKYFK